MNQEPTTLHFFQLGNIPYKKGLECQEACHTAIKAGIIHNAALFLEHPPTLTLGKHANKDFIIPNTQSPKADIYHTDRGGEVTAHNPGQLVLYPIIAFKEANLSVKKYVTSLENSIIATLGLFEIKSHLRDEYPGVWVNGNKICALGIRVREKISQHGLALNIDNDLSLFKTIIPCGITDGGVTSIKNELQKPIDHDSLALSLADILSKELGFLKFSIAEITDIEQFLSSLRA